MPSRPDIRPIEPAMRSRRELVADDPEGEREDRAAEALDHAATIISASVLARAAISEPDREACEHDHEHALLAEDVAEPAGDRRR